MFTKAQKLYLLMLVLLVIFGVLARNLVRSRIGRALAAVRDRDLAAEVIGVNVTRYKMIAFAVSSFYAGVAGALLYVMIGFVEPGSFNLVMSVQYIAMILIGGVATISGSILGALFITLVAAGHPRTAGRAAVHQQQFDRRRYHGLPGRDDPLRPADHRVPDLRTARAVRDLDPLRTYWKSWPFSH